MGRIFCFVMYLVLAKASQAADPSCSELYHKKDLIGQGVSKRVYLINPRSPKDGACWEPNCAEVVVKEGSQAHDPGVVAVEDKAVRLKVALPIYARGACVEGGNKISFMIEKRGFPLTRDKMRQKLSYYGGKIQRRIETLHRANILHGDPHLGNVMLDADDQVYLADFDRGGVVTDATRKGKFAFEDFYASAMWREQADWQPFVYKYKNFDTDNNGQIDGRELENLSDALGNWGQAVDVSQIYRDRMNLLPKTILPGLFLDGNNDGRLEHEEVNGKAKVDHDAYHQQVATWKANYDIFIPPPDLGTIRFDLRGQYKAWPLERAHVVLISGGDVNANRMYPLATKENFKELAKNRGYRFQHYSGNLASPFVGYWHKIYMILDKMNNPDHRVVVWLDDDGVVDTKSDFLERLLVANPDRDIIVATDTEDHAYLNSGFIVVRNTNASIAILRQLLVVGGEARTNADNAVNNWFAKDHLRRCKQDYHCLHEQQALKELYLGTIFTERDRGDYHRSNELLTNEQKAKILVIPQIGTLDGQSYQVNLLLKDGAYSPLTGKNANAVVEFLDPDQYGRRAQQGLPLPFFVQCASQGSDKAACVETLLQFNTATYAGEQAQLPPGNYKENCLACKQIGNFLQCSCRNEHGVWQPSWTFAACAGTITTTPQGGLRCLQPIAGPCDTYVRGALIKATGFQNTYGIEGDPTNSSIIKEFRPGGHILPQAVEDSLDKLGFSDQVINSGVCVRDGEPIYYRIQQLPGPLLAKSSGLEASVKELVTSLIANGLSVKDIQRTDLGLDSHGALTLTNLEDLYVDNDGDRDAVLARTMFRLSHLWLETGPWQTLAYRYKSFDQNANGKFEPGELRQLVSVEGEAKAKAIKILYEHRMAHLKRMDPIGWQSLLADLDNDGEVASSERASLASMIHTFITGDTFRSYDYADHLKERTQSYVPEVAHRVTDRGSFKKDPLLSSEILIISGGDIKPKRNFPIYTRHNHLRFAKKQQYKFQHYAGNLASDFVGYWHKIYMLMDKLSDPSNRVVVWFDDDGVINENSTMLERYLNAFPDKDMIIARDPEAFAYINSGALIVKNSERAVQLLADIITIGESRSHRLMTCAQAGDCLHEQQAIQMLLEHKVTSQSGINWVKHVEVVPQFDSKTGRNMNVLLKGGPFASFDAFTESSKNRYDDYADFKKSIGDFPFFAQCADHRQNKNICVRELLEVFEPGFIMNSNLAPPKGSYLEQCECLVVDNDLDCDCGGNKASLKLPCDLGSIELWGGSYSPKLVCVGRDKFPEGSYQETCEKCYRTANEFVCSCHDGAYKRESRLQIPCADGQFVENIGGKLTCLLPKKPLPEGEYSTYGCEYRGDTLKCGSASLKLPCPAGQAIESKLGDPICIDAKQPIPEGSFRKSCDKCLYRSNKMTCTCDGQKTTLDMPCATGKGIENIRGTLRCLDPLQSIPRGAYQREFSSCEQRGNVLTCETSRKKYVLQLPCATGTGVEFEDDKLQCLPPLKDLPQGSYLGREEQPKCQYRANTLTCSWRNNKQSLAVPCSAGQTIDLVKGKLECVDINTPPPGSYGKSCKDCTYKDGTMTCTCHSGGYGQDKPSMLPLPCPNVVNSYGELRCEPVK